MMRTTFLCGWIAALLLAGPALGAPDDEGTTVLELTYPAGPSPRVFTQGWVFGARCTHTEDNGTRTDLSSQVTWTGSGSFTPARGGLSHPTFRAEGTNTITLVVTVGGKEIRRSWTVTAVDPLGRGENGVRYARLGDLAECAADAHACTACPHHVVGPIVAGGPTVTIEGKPAARKGDAGVHAACCGSNTFKIADGDPTVLIDGMPAARVGDKTIHCGGVGVIIGPPQPYYAAFVVTWPELAPGKKIARAKGEDEAKWKERRHRWLAGLRVGDFTFDKTPDESKPLVALVRGLGLLKYPKLNVGTQYALHVKGRLPTDGGGSVPLSGSLLLRLHGSYGTPEELKKALPKVTDEVLAERLVLEREDGTGTVVAKGTTYALGPLDEGWTDANRAAAVELVKQVMAVFDCFIASAVYQDPRADEVNVFRRFREGVLRRSEAGRHLIDIYNTVGPGYARRLERMPGVRPLVKLGLDGLAGWLSGLDLDDAATARRLAPLIECADALASLLWRARDQGPLAPLGWNRR